MIADRGHPYVIENIVGKFDNPLHQEIVGRLCWLDILELGKFGWFTVEMDDGCPHRICTSIIKNISVTDDINDITLTTNNSVYTFKKYVTQTESVTAGGKI